MTPVALSRLLGWFSLGVGALEVAAPRTLARCLGVRRGGGFVRAFGTRRVAAGLAMAARPDSMGGPIARLAGDALDLAVLIPALSHRNPRRAAATAGFLLLAGVAALDAACAGAFVAAGRRRAAVARRGRVARPVARPVARLEGPAAIIPG